MASLNLSRSVVQILQDHPEQRFTARELAETIARLNPEACAEKIANSKNLETEADLLRQLDNEIRAQRPRWQQRHPELVVTEGRPRYFYWNALANSAETVAVAEQALAVGPTGTAEPAAEPLDEHALYPLLGQFLHTEFGLYPKRIDEKRSTNKHGPRGNIWLHPDLVGLEDLSAGWDREVRDCIGVSGDARCRLWSFEVKLAITRSNLRECFFQTVSNSSWAHFAYLVAAEISGQGTMQELRLLSAVHGIGFILLDVDAPADSEILIPARERPVVDWGSINRLATENSDFREFVRLVRHFHQTGETHRTAWDLPAEE